MSDQHAERDSLRTAQELTGGDDGLARLIVAMQRLAGAFPDAQSLHQLLVELAAWVAGADGASLERADGRDLVYTQGTGLLAAAVGTRVGRATSLSGLAVAMDEAQVSADTRGDLRVDLEMCQRLGVGSVVVLPMRPAHDVVSVLTVVAAQPGALCDRDLALLRPLAAVAAGRLENVATQSQRSAADHLLASVSEASRSILIAIEPATELCRWACRLVRAPLAVVFEPDGAGNLVTTARSRDDAPTLRLSLDEPSLAHTAFTTGRLQLVNDFRSRTDVSRSGIEALEATDLPDVSSVAYVPLTVSDRTIAVLAVLLPDRISAADAERLGLVTMLAAEAGLAIERGHLQQLLEEQARSDDLTGLPNRRTWRERLTLETARAARIRAPLCLVVLDLDHFKAYNDRHGHVAGDEALRKVGKIWTEALRDSDLLARLGGEEFAAILSDTSLEAGCEVAQRLLDAVPTTGLTASAGIALWCGEDADAFYRRADTALYAAKAAGRNQLAIADDHPDD